MNRMQRLEWDTEEWLFLCFHSLLGWPKARNRWLYPTVFGWDANEEGDNVIPGLITFYPNPEVPMDVVRRNAFYWHLERTITGPWRLVWRHTEGFLWAERTPYTQHLQDGPTAVVSRQLSTVEVQAVTSGYITNGRPDDGRSLSGQD